MSKKFLIKASLMATVVVFSLTGCDKEEIIPSLDLPSEITNYISIHFPNNTIVQAINDRGVLTKTYDILLSESISLEFNRKKDAKEKYGFEFSDGGQLLYIPPQEKS